MSKAAKKISDAEQQLLELLWDDSPLSATQIAERVSASRDWNLSTVKTMLSRLVAKGVLAAEADGRRFLYRPLVPREAVASRQASGLVDRLFGGRVSPLVAQLAEERSLSKEDLDELEALVRSLKS